MKKTIKFFAILMLLAFSTAAFSSCNETNEGDNRVMIMNFVTYNGASGNGSTYTLQTGPNSPELTLFANQTLNSEVKAGTRVVIVYYTPDDKVPTTDTAIELLQVGYAENGSARPLPADSLQNWNENPTFVQAMWRTGYYINMNLRVRSTYDLQSFKLIADESTLDNELPDLYLINNTPDNYALGYSNYYASLSVADIMTRPNVKGVKIHVNNSNIPTRGVFTFLRDAKTPEAVEENTQN